MEIFKFELEQKMDHPSSVEFNGESSGDSLNAQKLRSGGTSGASKKIAVFKV